jgi:NAD(P)-dependent dehydrogenase (short-subunit alcohol dehydrogenase family)
MRSAPRIFFFEPPADGVGCTSIPAPLHPTIANSHGEPTPTDHKPWSTTWPGSRIILMTSGQDLGPMRDEVAYATTKGALASITPTLADHLADQAITLNTINPGRCRAPIEDPCAGQRGRSVSAEKPSMRRQ